LPNIRKHGNYVLESKIKLLEASLNEANEKLYELHETTPPGCDRVWVPGDADDAAILQDVRPEVRVPLRKYYWKWYIYKQSWAYAEVMEKWGAAAKDRVYLPKGVNPKGLWEYGLIYDDVKDLFFYNARYKWSTGIVRTLKLREPEKHKSAPKSIR